MIRFLLSVAGFLLSYWVWLILVSAGLPTDVSVAAAIIVARSLLQVEQVLAHQW